MKPKKGQQCGDISQKVGKKMRMGGWKKAVGVRNLKIDWE